jgi:hypothetical protein
VDSATWELLRAADLGKQGLWPVAGGAEDQATVFLDGLRFVRSEEAYWTAELTRGKD